MTQIYRLQHWYQFNLPGFGCVAFTRSAVAAVMQRTLIWDEFVQQHQARRHGGREDE